MTKHPAGQAITEVSTSVADPAASNAVLMIIPGVFTRFAYDNRTVAASAELERLLQATAIADHPAHVAE